MLHFAAHLRVEESVSEPAKYYRNNVVNALGLFELAVRHGVSNVVFSSTCAVYGEPQVVPIAETTPLAPINPYGASKMMAERMLQDIGAACGLRHVILRYFNVDAFAQNPAGTFGTSGRNILRGPGNATVDFGLLKNFAVRERHRLQFRAEFFNLFNRVNLGNPNTNRNAGNFGRITSAGSPRVAQLALKYTF